MPQHHQPERLLSLCHIQVATNLVSTCRLLQLIAQDLSAAHALTLARRRFRPNLLSSLPGLIRSQLIEEVSKLLSAPAPDGSAGGAGPAPLYLLALLLAPDVHRLRVELCCYYGCSHQAALLRLLATEGRGLEFLELARSALLRLDRSLLHDALVSATSLRHLILRNIAGDAVLQVIGTACPNLIVLDVSHSRQVTDSGLRHLFLQVELRDKASPSTASTKCDEPDLGQCVNPSEGCNGRGWGRLRILLRLFPKLRFNREGENKMKDRSFLLEYCERRNPLCDTLRVLNVANTGVTSAGILLALHHVPHIQSLGDYGHMGRALEILDRAWTASTENVDSQAHPSFSLISARCQRTTMRRLELLSLSCPALQKLTISEPHHPPSALHVFPPTLTTLHLLSIPSDTKWISGLYTFLATPQGLNLQDLTLRFFPSEMTVSIDLCQILKSCPNLHTLIEDGADIHWNSPQETEVPPLINLRNVQLGRVVTAKSLMELLKRAPSLEIAHFYSCPDLTDNHLISLTAKSTTSNQHCSDDHSSSSMPSLSQYLECFYIYEASHITAPAVVTLFASCERLVKTGNLSNWGLDCEGMRWIHSTILDNNLNLEINTGSHWFCSPCFPLS
ncbi:hypothetical protein L9F63_026504 [Diploptera punctata]|uniref:Uncharacterized protein n=1 Tax=Diploptera punctata TaxID=6984 RepID=A0AAD8AII8_DIPPU|nr:hypothetical protein L9F63_026504 [Diploptera punctata]